jgi:hypothetical protein
MPRETFLAEPRRRSHFGLLVLGQDRQQPWGVGQGGTRATGKLGVDEDELGADRLLDEAGRFHTSSSLRDGRGYRLPSAFDFCRAPA